MQSPIISSSRRSYGVPVFMLGTVCFLATTLSAHAMTSGEHFTQMEMQLKTASEQLSLLQTLQPTGSVLGASTTVPVVVPVRPVCRLTLDKKSYTLGETIKLSWQTTGGHKVELLTDTSGKDALVVPQGDFKVASGYVSISATVLGNPMVSLKVTSKTGHAMICTRVIPVMSPDVSKKDARLAPLHAQVINLGNQLARLITSRETLDQRINELKIKELELLIKIEKLVGSTPVPQAAVTASLDNYSGAPLPDLSAEYALASFTTTIEVTAGDHDAYIPKLAAAKTGVAGTGFLIGFKDKNGRDVSSGVRTNTVASTAKVDKNNRYIVTEGTSEKFTITTTFAADKSIDNSYRFAIKGVNYYSNPDIDPAVNKASLMNSEGGQILGETGYMLDGRFGFKG